MKLFSMLYPLLVLNWEFGIIMERMMLRFKRKQVKESDRKSFKMILHRVVKKMLRFFVRKKAKLKGKKKIKKLNKHSW